MVPVVTRKVTDQFLHITIIHEGIQYVKRMAMQIGKVCVIDPKQQATRIPRGNTIKKSTKKSVLTSIYKFIFPKQTKKQNQPITCNPKKKKSCSTSIYEGNLQAASTASDFCYTFYKDSLCETRQSKTWLLGKVTFYKTMLCLYRTQSHVTDCKSRTGLWATTSKSLSYKTKAQYIQRLISSKFSS